MKILRSQLKELIKEEIDIEMGNVESTASPDYIQTRLDADEDRQDSELQKIEDQYGIPFTNRDFRYVLFSYITRMDELIEGLDPTNLKTKMMTRMANRIEFYFETLLTKHRLLTIAFPAQSNEVDKKLSMLYYGHPNIADAFRDHLMRILDKVEKSHPDIAEKCTALKAEVDLNAGRTVGVSSLNAYYNLCYRTPCVDLALDFKKENIPDNSWLLYNATPQCKNTFRTKLGNQDIFQRIAAARHTIKDFNEKVTKIVSDYKHRIRGYRSSTLSPEYIASTNKTAGEKAITEIEEQFELVHRQLEGFLAIFEEGKRKTTRTQLKQIIKEELEAVSGTDAKKALKTGAKQVSSGGVTGQERSLIQTLQKPRTLAPAAPYKKS